MIFALVMSSIVLIGISIVVTGARKHVRDGMLKIDLQRDFSFIETFLSNNILASTGNAYQIYATYADYKKSKPAKKSGACLKLVYSGKQWRLLFKHNSNLRIIYSDSRKDDLVTDVVSKLVFKKQPGGIETFIALNRGTWNVEGTLVHAFRN